MSRIHPLTGNAINGKAVNGKPRPELAAAMGTVGAGRRAALSFDAARSGTDLDGHWAFADALDPDSSYSRQVRQTLAKRSRYEQGSNGIYDGILISYTNMLCGETGPKLRMLTGNRVFNQLVEREFAKWMEATQLRRKLWAMAHARIGDGESFALLQTNPGLKNDVQLDLLPIECEQCQTPFGEVTKGGQIDGIYYDEYNNILGYDILPVHPGSSSQFLSRDPIPVAAANVLHWFKLKRPGAHRGIPDCTSTLNVGASSRRFREATVGAAESAASPSLVSSTNQGPAGEDEPDPIAPFTGVPLPHRSWLFNPMGWSLDQIDAKHPNASYESFTRSQTSETARPLSVPYNLAACDSSTYSFASGKLDTICFRTEIGTSRQDCNELVLDRIFAAWFREWTIIADKRDMPPLHQWDWPTHPVIDAVAEENAKDTKLKNGTITLRQVFSDQGQDLEDQLAIMADDIFGTAEGQDEQTTAANITKCRQILTLKNSPQHAIQYIAQVLGLQVAPTSPQQATEVALAASAEQIKRLNDRLTSLESQRR